MSLFNKRKKTTQKNTRVDKPKNEFIASVAEETKRSYEETAVEMKAIKEQLGIPYKVYCRKQLYKKTRPDIERYALAYHRRKMINEEKMQIVAEQQGITIADVRQAIKDLNGDDRVKIKINAENYEHYGMFLMDSQELYRLTERLAQVKTAAEELKPIINRVRNAELPYETIADDVKKMYSLVEKTMTPYLRSKLLEELSDLEPGLAQDPERAEAIPVDVEVARLFLDAKPTEYKTYHLYESDFKGKLDYIFDEERKAYSKAINSQKITDTVNNKYNFYNKFKPLFSRDMIVVNSMDDYETFKDFVTKHPEFVIKPLSTSFGEGVGLERVEPGQVIRAYLQSLLEERKTFLLEERIIADPRFAAFNEDSVNTVRIIVYYDGETAFPLRATFRAGRQGSFVDNAGSGGIVASIDVETGRFNSDGGDENGFRYTEHPESHSRFRDFQVPEWDKAIALVKDAIASMGEPCIIGWDLALNDRQEWVIVEGNCRPQYTQQGPLGYGVGPMVREVLRENPCKAFASDVL